MKARLVGSGTDAGSRLRVQRSAGRALFAILAMIVMQPAFAGPIDLRDFFFFPGDPVVLGSTDGAASGSFAQISESPELGAVVVSDDPGLGDLVLINSAEGPVLRFQYEFDSESPADCVDCDTLLATLFAAVPNDPSVGGPLDGFLGDVVITTSGVGVVSFLLSSFNLAANEVFGLQFELLSFDAGSGSSAVIRSLEVLDPATVKVPEPASVTLLLSGLIGMMIRRGVTASLSRTTF